MKTDRYIFKENLSLLYVFLGIQLILLACLWIGHDAFPFGNDGAIGLFIVIIAFLLNLIYTVWGNIKHPKKVIIDANGIHHYNRESSLLRNSTLWLDDYMFYSWDNVQGFHFEWTDSGSRCLVLLRYLVLEQGQDALAIIRLNELHGKKHNYIDAIEKCSGGRCALNFDEI